MISALKLSLTRLWLDSDCFKEQSYLKVTPQCILHRPLCCWRIGLFKSSRRNKLQHTALLPSELSSSGTSYYQRLAEALDYYKYPVYSNLVLRKLTNNPLPPCRLTFYFPEIYKTSKLAHGISHALMILNCCINSMS